MRCSSAILLTTVCAGMLLLPGMARGEDVRTIIVKAAEAFEQGMGAWGVRAAGDGSAVVLHDRMLIDDDGPGIGSDSKWLKPELKSPVQTIEGDVRIKKVLHVSRPESIRAYLVLPRGVQVQLNGSPVETDPKARYPEIPVSLLKAGDNEIVLSCAEGQKRRIKIAPREEILRNAPGRAARPRRSFLSTDGGTTWKPIEGEFLVRMHLIQYAAEGHMISQAIDLAAGGPLATVLTGGSLTVTTDAETPKGTGVDLTVRTGTTPLYEKDRWTDWQTPSAAVPAGHRYVQWRATLRTSSPLETPKLKNVTIKATVAAAPPPEWAKKVTVAAMHNPDIRTTSISFANEDFTHQKLADLRKKYKLDEVVAKGKTEYERLLLLKDWVRKQWKYKPATERYPAWDADEIMQLKRGFCVQFAIVYMQCSLSLGYTSRFVFGYHPGVVSTGHEVTEVWSNEYDKWILIDANGNVHYVDPKTKVPLGMLEVHDRMLAIYYGDKPLSRSNFKGRLTAVSDQVGTCWGAETAPGNIDSRSIAKKRPPRWAKWGIIRMMPRNNFYSQIRPLPKTQGFTWDYSDYWIWEDAQTPPHYAYRYRNITGRRSDWQWTPNRVRFDTTCSADSRALTVRMSTVTPGFKTFVIRTDGGPWRPVGRDLTWTLHVGRNKLEMRTRNALGVEGAVSSIELDLAR
jgi:transglutaminase-like putative cysteine protease